MQIAALGNLTHDQQVEDGGDAVRIAGHVILQAAFIAPGLALFGVRGWRLVGGSLGGSASFTLLSWLWAYANGFRMLPMTAGERKPSSSPQPPARRRKTPSPALDEGEIIDL